MKKTIRHEASRISTWGLGAIAALGNLYDYLPALKETVSPKAFGIIATLALLGKVGQRVVSRGR